MRARLTRLLAAVATAAALVAGGAADVDASSNGRLPDRALSPAAQGGCVQLARPAAKAYNAMQLRAGRVLPVNGCDSAYRTVARQVFWRNFWCARGKCGNAAPPGTSNHGWGLAADVPPSTRSTIDNVGHRFGWCKIPRRIGLISCFSDAAHESWHVRWTGGIHKGARNPCPLREGDRDPCVRGLERRLKAHGFFARKPDKTFGARTRRGVIRFQRSRRLAADGAVGPATWKQLYRKPAPKKPPVPQPTPPGPGPIPDPPPKPKVSRPAKGVDVSSHQGSIEWPRVRGAGYRFAIVKASEGQDFRDPTFDTARVRAIRSAGMRVGTYHFLRPRPGRTGAVEARFYVKTSRGAGIDWRKGKDLRPVADIESTTLGPLATSRYLRSFVREVKRLTGRRTLIYTFPSFATEQLATFRPTSADRLWIAHVGVSKPVIPTPWAALGYTAWQHSWTGRVAGIRGDVDLNITTTAALRALAAR